MPLTRFLDIIFGSSPAPAPAHTDAQPDFSDVRGQDAVRGALTIAVAGGHNILMIGPPGSGKSMLAKRVPSILPPLTEQLLAETNAVYASAGGWYRSSEPPFQAPHHTASYAALVGGGSAHPKPGAISLAHNGVLFLDELPEFNRGTLESLRQPLEEGRVTISRTSGTAIFPARFLLIAAMNPCPCGYAPYPQCTCKPLAIQKYNERVSGPILDRIDIHVNVPSVSLNSLQGPPSKPSAYIRGQVCAARQRQYDRAGRLNASLEIGDFDAANIQMLKDVLKARPLIEKGDHLSARAYVRILRVARTLADLYYEDHVSEEHIEGAILLKN